MRSFTSSSAALLLALGATIVLTPTSTEAGRGPGAASAFVIETSPTLGTFVPLAVRINGYNAGGIAKGHTYVTYLSPGRHFIEVSRSGRAFGRWRRTIFVRPGQDYVFLAKYRADEVVLQPLGWSR